MSRSRWILRHVAINVMAMCASILPHLTPYIEPMQPLMIRPIRRQIFRCKAAANEDNPTGNARADWVGRIGRKSIDNCALGAFHLRRYLRLATSGLRHDKSTGRIAEFANRKHTRRDLYTR